MSKVYSILRAMNAYEAMARAEATEQNEPMTRDGSVLRDWELRFNRQVVDLSDEDDEDEE